MPPHRNRRLRSATALLSLLIIASALLPAVASALPDGRGWELVSPVDKNGGSIAAPEGIAAGGVLQASADGNSITYGSVTSFATDALGAPPGSQYLSARSTSGWSTANLSQPIFAGSYGAEPDGVPYQLFSEDLTRGLLLSGRHCRSAEAGCPVANPPLPGADAPAGYENYYLRQAAVGFEALLGTGDVANTDLEPAGFDLRFAGTSPDLAHVVLESCAALTAGAGEVPLGEGCDPTVPNLYEWSAATGLVLVNSTPGAELAAQGGAVSEDGSRVYWKNTNDNNLYLREGVLTKQVDLDAGGGGAFRTASADGAVAYFTKAGKLYRYEAQTDSAAEIAAAVTGVFGTSSDGSHLYYLSVSGLRLWSLGTTTELPTAIKNATAADPSNFPPTSGSARVSADGTHLLFTSSASLTGYNNLDQKTGLPDSEVFLYDASANVLRCVSCRPSGVRPIGSSTIPGSFANGAGSTATDSYKPRALSADGLRAFFDSADALAPGDVNHESDVYQWEAQGANCAKANGCIEAISNGRSEEGARFVDASTSGDDVFFTTDASLVGTDPGSVDLYDARVGGGFPEPLIPIPCFGDTCQNLPSEPVDPGLGTLVTGPGNPKVHYVKHGRGAKHKRCAGKSKCHKQSKGAGGKSSMKSKRGAPR